MFNWKRIQQLVGETIREIGILVVVFVPLEVAFAEKLVEPIAIIGVMLFALGSIAVGIIAETRD